jgi:hypothetical protein
MMSAHTVARGILAIKVTEIRHGATLRKVAMEWIDEAGECCQKAFYGHSAAQIDADLAHCTSISEDARHGYLLGLIRGTAVKAVG